MYVSGSVHVTDEQSVLGGGGGNDRRGEGGGALKFLREEPNGETLGGKIGMLWWLEEDVDDPEGADAGEDLILGEGRGDWEGETEGPCWL